MIFRRNVVPAVVVAAACFLLFASRASAQDAFPGRIAIVNQIKVLNAMQETKDLNDAVGAKRQQIEAEGKKRQDEVADAYRKRALWEEGTAEFNKANAEAMKVRVDFEVWKQIVKMNADREQKLQWIALFAKIEAATKQVAEAKKLDLVLVEQRFDTPKADVFEQMTPDQVRSMLAQRNVVYNNGKLDVTNDVLKQVDENYRNKK